VPAKEGARDETREIIDRINKLLEEEKRIEAKEEQIFQTEKKAIRLGQGVAGEVFIKGIVAGVIISAVMIFGYLLLFG
jgi:hypothetical protein